MVQGRGARDSTTTVTPKVTFLVLCYKLAHFLPDCVNSILAQTYRDFEIIILDDCSPDETPRVAASFNDPRVRHIRHERNLGHLRNGNAGVGHARGEYLWMISADDRLRQSYALERFVSLLEQNPSVGYVFCPAMKLKDGVETVLCGGNGPADAIFRGHAFLTTQLLKGNSVCASAVLARRACYEKVGLLPLDLPFAADWYMWAMFAMYFDVGYFAEPMLNYRIHDANMSAEFVSARQHALVMNDLMVGWRLRAEAERVGNGALVQSAREALADRFAYHARLWAAGDRGFGISLEEIERSLAQEAPSPADAAAVRSLVFATLGDHYYDAGDAAAARAFYGKALNECRANLRIWVKYVLLHFGAAGRFVRRALIGARTVIEPSAAPRIKNGIESSYR
jgi:glycosyltransferase involved in cell wall biosynthesis